MDFFESQDRARRKTGRLVVLYAIAVALIVAAIYSVAAAISLWGSLEADRPLSFWQPELFFGVSAATVAVIAIGSVYRIVQLRSGGARVAEMMGGRRVNPGTSDPDERQLLNVVEEMAIASGVPVPDIFVMDNEEGINAFAAGYSPSDAAVAVTRGCLKKLKRDELQGVIAHEFSHILNGDMRLNIRLIGILNGILLLHLIGYMIVNSLRFARFRSSRGGKGGGGGIVVVFIVGIALMIIGYIGVLFSRMIQAAVSRQREYLADAAAVQFTRNPEGIAGALKKIGGANRGSRVEASHAMEANHMFFANGIASSLSNVFATHPPLAKRIRAIDPSFDGKSWISPAMEPAKPARPKPEAAKRPGPFEPVTKPFPMKPEALLATIGTIQASKITKAERIMEAIPKGIRDAIHDPAGAEAVIYCLLLSRDPAIREQQMAIVREHSLTGVGRETANLHQVVDSLPLEARLPVVDLSLPALRQLSQPQFEALQIAVTKLIASDNQVSLFEFALEKVLLRHLGNHFSEGRRKPIQYYGAGGIAGEFSVVLSALSHAGDKDTKRAFAAASARLPKIDIRLEPTERCTLEIIDKALNKLDLASYPVKKQLLEAAISAIVSDGKVAPDEAELLRAIADSLDCPMPPL